MEERMGKGPTSQRIARKLPAGTNDWSQWNVESEASIVARMLVYFGAGYGVQMQADGQAPTCGPDSPPDFAISRSHADLTIFFNRLLESTQKHYGEIKGDDGLQKQIERAAYCHGILARQQVTADHNVDKSEPLKLSFDQIYLTLKDAQAAYCKKGGGGGPVCDF
jgi:hypothetical protein